VTPADDIIEPELPTRPVRALTCRPRATSGRNPRKRAHPSPLPNRGTQTKSRTPRRSPASSNKASRSTAVPTQRAEGNLATAATQAAIDCWIGAVTLYVVYFGSTAVFLVLLVIDWLAGTRSTKVDWILPTKLTVLAAGLVWTVLLLGPSTLIMWILGGDPSIEVSTRALAKRIRPMVGAITFCLGLYGGYQVWENAPPLPQWEGEYVNPKTDTWAARSTAWTMETLTRECIRQIDYFGISRRNAQILGNPLPPPLTPRCTRPDMMEAARRWETDWLIRWATELAPSSNAEPFWVKQG
jgi:hypothetical protein